MLTSTARSLGRAHGPKEPKCALFENQRLRKDIFAPSSSLFRFDSLNLAAMAGLVAKGLASMMLAAAQQEEREDTEDKPSNGDASREVQALTKVLAKHRTIVENAIWNLQNEEAVPSERGPPRRPREVRNADTDTSPSTTPPAARRLSDALKLVACTGPEGRHMVAARTIGPGEVLIEEEAFAWAVEPGTRRCAHCLERLPKGAAVGCGSAGKKCCELFCSDLCAATATRSWHRTECGRELLRTLPPRALAARRLADRLEGFGGDGRADGGGGDDYSGGGGSTAVATSTGAAAVGLTASVAGVAAASGLIEPVVPGCDASGRYVGGAAGAAALQAHWAEMPTADQFLFVAEAALAALPAGATSVTRGDGEQRGDTGDGSMSIGGRGVGNRRSDHGGSGGGGGGVGEWNSGEFSLAVKRLTHVLCQVATNSFAVASAEEEEESEGAAAAAAAQRVRHMRRGVAVFPTAAMLNHSCEPNAIVRFDGTSSGEGGGTSGSGAVRATVVATRSIALGAGVTVSYGPMAWREPAVAARRAALRRSYGFDCRCDACLSDSAAAASFATSLATNNAGVPSAADGARLNAASSFAATIDNAKKGAAATAESGRKKIGAAAYLDRSTAVAATAGKRTGLSCPREDCDSELAVRVRAVSGPFSDHPELQLVCVACRAAVPDAEAVARLDELRAVDRRFRAACEELWPDDGETAAAAATTAKMARAVAKAKAREQLRECCGWRDRRCPPLSLRAAQAHEAMARTLHETGDVAGAAAHTVRSVAALAALRQRARHGGGDGGSSGGGGDDDSYADEGEELGRERQKLATLLLAAGRPAESAAECRRAQRALSVCLAPGDRELQELAIVEAMATNFDKGQRAMAAPANAAMTPAAVAGETTLAGNDRAAA
ncbi:unnamed protein product [Phaeothamnion confervicola]